jgi:hypothetical protein
MGKTYRNFSVYNRVPIHPVDESSSLQFLDSIHIKNIIVYQQYHVDHSFEIQPSPAGQLGVGTELG